MKKRAFCFTIIFFTLSVTAQETENIAVMGPQVFDYIANEGYRYPSFKKAVVYFTNAGPGAGRLNYNYLLQTMQFISEKGDTLVFADEKAISYIAIGSDTFIYDNAFYEIKATSKKYKLAKKTSIKLLGEPQKLGAFGIASATNNIPSEDVARGFGYSSRLDVNEQFNFTRQTTWFVSVEGQPFAELNKKSIQRLFLPDAGKVNGFIKQYSINLGKETDVLSLFAFINQLN
ncbi:MAG: hypothetical protein IPP72_00890 [Chitinophagaceae bacterium]|nr:hypothetical protein [Chitinophagaceae bacterium]